MGLYIVVGVIGGLVSVYVYFLVFYDPDAHVLKEFWKDFLQNIPIKKKSSFTRMQRRTVITDTRLFSEEVQAYPSPSVFWLKIIKHFITGAFIGVAILYLL